MRPREIEDLEQSNRRIELFNRRRAEAYDRRISLTSEEMILHRFSIRTAFLPQKEFYEGLLLAKVGQ